MSQRFAATLMLAGIVSHPAAGQSCRATRTSIGDTAVSMPIAPPSANAGLRLRRELELPGPPNRFDYQSIDSARRRLYMNHMNGNETLVFDLDSERVVGRIPGVSRATGVLVVPALGKVYISAAGNHRVAIVDDKSLKAVASVPGIRFPDGIAYADNARKIFISDESGDADVVADAATGDKRSTIPLGGEAGNTHYDRGSGCILVAVQTRNQLVAIDPQMERIVQRYDLPGSDHPHGFAIDPERRLAFITSEANALLQVVDLRTMKILASHKVGDSPDVLAWDASWGRLYVASEGGVLSAFRVDGVTLVRIADLRIAHGHTVSVDPLTHRVHLPLESQGGHPLLRIYDAIR